LCTAGLRNHRDIFLRGHRNEELRTHKQQAAGGLVYILENTTEQDGVRLIQVSDDVTERPITGVKIIK